MNNEMNYPFSRILDMKTGQYIDTSLPYDIVNASGESSPSAAGTFTVASFTVNPGEECIIGQVSLGAAAATLAEVTTTYTDFDGTSVTLTRYLYLGAAGYIETNTDFANKPFMVFVNPVNSASAATVNMNIISAAESTQYMGNMAYVARLNE